VRLRADKAGIKAPKCDKAAEFYGGGGHDSAASFYISKKRLMKLFV
jgi:nanoRNase/pAp phosphatase (c-di-AMP/oligoRNAs hydrolase)